MADKKFRAFGTKRTLFSLGSVLLIGIIAAVYASTRSSGDIGPGESTPAVDETEGPVHEENVYSLNIKLSDGQSQPLPALALPLASTQPLSADEIKQILSRLPALPPDTTQQEEFNRPAESLPPPRAGQTIKEAFPPARSEIGPETVETGPLQVLRFSPEGEIPLAPFISLTFNQPMVPVGTLGDLAARDVPVVIEPALPGTWRWLGTRTLTFEYDSGLVDRMPMATEYRVTVPAGTKSATGGALNDTVTWTFTTPPPTMVSSYPDGSPQPLEPIFFVAFDQRIDPPAVLQTIKVTAGYSDVKIVLADQSDIDKDEQVSQLVKNANEGRWLAFRAEEPFPTETNIDVTIGPNTPSAEGPRTTTAAQSFSFSTYSALRIEEHACSWYQDRCPPLTPWYIRFNNPLDMEAFTQDMLQVQPELPGLSVTAYGNTLEISGMSKGRTTYTVRVSRDIQDAFGQKLGREARLTFKVDQSDPFLIGPEQNFVTLDPSASRAVFSVYAINYTKLNAKIYSVQPADWPVFIQYLSDWRQTDQPAHMPGSLLSDAPLSLNLPADTLTQVDVDLSRYMSGSSGQFVVIIEPPAGLFESDQDKWKRYSQTVIAWVQVTHIGLDAYVDHSEMVAWATDLSTGAPLSGVTLRAENQSAKNLTGKDGVARFDIPSGANYLVAQNGSDQAILPSSFSVWGAYPWTASWPADTLRWYVFDDRAMYRPGEEVHVKGWLRRIGGRQDGDVGLVGGDLSSISYQIIDPMGNDLASGQLEPNSLGGFDFAFTLPEEVNLGYAYISFVASGNLNGLEGLEYSHNFSIQEFRRPEFEVSTRTETSGPYFAGDQATLAVEAKYYAGGGLPNAEVTWNVTTSSGHYAPPHWDKFTFGTWKPWWFYDYQDYGGDTQTQTFTAKTDASGAHYLQLDLQPGGDPGTDPEPKSVLAEASVMDVNRQAWNGSTALLVHPADLYVGIHSDRYFVEHGTPLKIDYIVTDLDGNALAGKPVQLTAARLEWKFKNGDWTEQKVDIQTCQVFSETQPAACTFETAIGGSYQITAIVTDDLGRKNQSRFMRWVSGGQQPPSRKVEQEKVTLIPDKETYQPGDTAQILVQSPFAPAEGLLTVSRSGILYTQRFRVEQGSYTLSIPIEEGHIPNLNIQVDLSGAAPRTGDDGEPIPNAPSRPAYASGQLSLSIPPLQRTLALELVPDQAALEPGGETTLTVRLQDARGNPVPDAEVAVVVVDEAILALTDYSLSNPLDVFYTARPSDVSSTYGRASIILADPRLLAAESNQAVQREALLDAAGAPVAMPAPSATQAPAMGGGEGGGGAAPRPMTVRTNFNPLALFAPTVRTGLNGEARVYVELPDNLTRYRIMAVAVDDKGNRFGTGASNLTARLPLMVRPSAPRFLNFGDKFELPVVLQNQTDLPMNVQVVARAANLEIENNGQLVTVPANDRVEVRFPASTVMAGTAQVQFAAVAGIYEDAATVQLPVYTPATSEAFATYGVIDEGTVAQPVQYPTGVFPQYGGLEIDTSSTALQALTDAVLYLVEYPFECSEQLASRMIAIASLRDVLTAFEVEGLQSPEELSSAVNRDVTRLQSMQNYDGGFPYWRRGFDSVPFNTIHVTHALIRAGQKGYSVPADMQQNALNYLREIENYYPAWYGQQTRWTLSAYALYVRNLAGDRDSAKAESLLQEAGLENLSMQAIGWLWPVIDDSAQLDAIRTYVNNHVVETAGAANFTTAYDDQTYLLLSSDRRTDAILLDALMGDNPQSDLIPKVVNGLLAHRVKGRWENTQENVFVLLALDRYFNTYEAQAPDFVARIWLGDTYAGSSEFRERTTDRHQTFVPMSYVMSETSAAGGTQDLVLSKDGPGRLYYRLGLRYAPVDLQLDALDMGFVIQRRYEAVDEPADVSQDSEGLWHIKAGARLRVRITMMADNRRYHVALVDPLPAGLETVNPELAVTGSIPQDPASPDYRYGWWWWGPWYEHQNLRDDRAEAFTSLLWDGVYQYSYVARATTPGTFVVPPARAEEMYSPEVFGRSSSDLVIVE